MPLLLVQAFLNTRELDEGMDLLADLDTAGPWLREAGLLPADRELHDSQVEQVRELREAIRDLVEAGAVEARAAGRDVVEAGAAGRDVVEAGAAGDGVGSAEPDLGPLRQLAGTHYAKLAVGAGGVLAIENARDEEVEDRLFSLLLIVFHAQEGGTWRRLKVCANPDCRWAFYDRSRNQQGNWCDMAVCGNRIKNRQLRARRR
jgi:predicted RNA-binding Zn ribbon-like protein